MEEHAFHLAIVLLMGHNRGAALAEFAERRDQQRHRPHARLCLRLSLSLYSCGAVRGPSESPGRKWLWAGARSDVRPSRWSADPLLVSPQSLCVLNGPFMAGCSTCNEQ